MGSRREAIEERLQREQAELLRRHLDAMRAAERPTVLPPAPSADDLARYARATSAQVERADALLRAVGLTRADLARADAHLHPANDDVDEVTRARARSLRRAG